MQLRHWAKAEGSGACFDSSGGFVLPNRAVRSPDAAWIKRSRLETFSPTQRKKFIPLCPDFVLELRTSSDELAVLQLKMQEYLDNGAQLAWLLDPDPRRAFIYRSGMVPVCLESPDELSGENVLPGFVLDVQEIW